MGTHVVIMQTFPPDQLETQVVPVIPSNFSPERESLFASTFKHRSQVLSNSSNWALANWLLLVRFLHVSYEKIVAKKKPAIVFSKTKYPPEVLTVCP